MKARYRYIVVPEWPGYVVLDRRTNAVVTPVLSRKDARAVVWERNGRHGSPPAGARKPSGEEQT